MKDINLTVKKNANFIFETDGVLLNIMANDVSTVGYYPRRKHPLYNDFHTHLYYELFFVVDGALNVYFEDEVVQLSKNTVLIIRPETPHHTKIDDEDGASRYTFDFVFHTKKKTETANTLCDFFSFPKYLMLKIDDFCHAQLDFFVRALSECEQTMAGCHFLSFLLGASKLLDKEMAEKPSLFNDTEANRLYKIERLCSAFYAEEFPLSLLAEELHLSERQVERIIKKHFGYGFHALITSYRMRAAELLLLRGTPVGEISEAVGYGSPSAFHRAFRNTYGCSPNEYLKKKREEN